MTETPQPPEQPPPEQSAALAELHAAVDAEREARQVFIAAQQRLFAAQDACAKYAVQGLNPSA
ncbi:hypothetical protein [Mycobacterium asiaticum]|uniref:hypothetical protein n=1 Tax=Mycobacterium asiaticum TaxID=1790 RepID=UPI0007EFDFE1|nr:hypothetical protein [Mycobacterium asiaticum]OBJ47546.1 hypothetical protein A9W94_05245 [Mycobacterium asiaticum]OBJ58005.1 hypothetical protein A9W94_17010 [Mycobacterium asiaticum]OBJ60245.1 hypothetical protein A9W94_13855 [Mycobacterium asiaticum]